VGDFVRQQFVAANDVTLAEAYSVTGILSDDRIQRKIDEVQIERAERGSVVIDSKLGLYILRGRYDWGVWVSAGSEVCAKRLAERSGILLEAALEALLMREIEERRVWSSLYGAEVLRIHERADMSVDTTVLGIGEAVNLVLENMSRR
jgi:cytidylate kinase